MAVTFDRIGKLLVGAKLISEQQLREAVAIQKQKGGNHLSGTLVKMGLIEEDKLLSFLSQQYRIPAVNLNSYQFIDPSIIKLVPIELVKKHMVLPLKRVGSNLTVAMADPTNVFGLDDLKFRTNYSIQPVIASESALLEAIKKYDDRYEPSAQSKKRDGVSSKDHGQAGYRRTAAAPRRAHQAEAGSKERCRFSGVGNAHAVRREGVSAGAG